MNNKNRNRAVAKAETQKKSDFTRRIFLSLLSASFLLALFVLGGNAFADNKDPDEQEKARQFIEVFADRAIGVLNNKELTEEETLGEYRSILNEAFALDYIARITLSRHRRKATEAELAEYFNLFPEFILKVNASRLQKLDTAKIDIERVTPHAKSDIFIRTKAYNSENKSIDVDWRVRSDKNGNVRIIDVKIEGISLVATQRDDFTARISSSGISGLNQYMKDIIDGLTVAEEETTS
jgi:phospholipid transport system substrate-binding protein